MNVRTSGECSVDCGPTWKLSSNSYGDAKSFQDILSHIVDGIALCEEVWIHENPHVVLVNPMFHLSKLGLHKSFAASSDPLLHRVQISFPPPSVHLLVRIQKHYGMCDVQSDSKASLPLSLY